MRIIYTIFIQIYLFLATLLSAFNNKARLWVQGRKNILKNIEAAMQGNTAPIAWFHCASLGEFEQGRPVIETFRKEFPDYKIFLTFFSPSGYEVRKNYTQAAYIFYLPIDTKYNAATFIHLVNPEVAFFTKYEFWYHYLNELKIANIPAISFSSIFRQNQVFFQPYGKFYKNFLTCFRIIFVQDMTSLALLQKHGILQAEVSGDTRFDRVLELAAQKKNIPYLESFKNTKKLLIIGSSWPADIDIVCGTLKHFHELKIIIAPHEIHESGIAEIEKKFPGISIRYSMIRENSLNHQVLIIDNIGMLSSLYQYADYACIGGGFGKGIHNILEAAAYGMPVLFGPNFNKFKEAQDLKKNGCAFSFHQAEDFKSIFEKLFYDEALCAEIAEKSRSYVAAQAGATKKILNFCHTLLEKKP
jgi:3-deoxy-D-manno-octulosonic-acid transferase